MRTLNYQLKVLCEHNRDGSYVNKHNRSKKLQHIANQLHDLGFVNLNAHSLNKKHVETLVAYWTKQNLSPRSQANYLAYVRWWAKKVGRSDVMYRTNLEYGIVGTSHKSIKSKAWTVTPAQLALIRDPYLRLSIRMQQSFGLRREESMKYRSSYADHHDYIDLKGSWTKGGRPRMIPVTMPDQRPLLDEVRETIGDGSLIPPDLKFVEQMKKYEMQTTDAGMKNLHGLRHGYAQRRYLMLTGWPCPYQGGKVKREMTKEEFARDQEARFTVSQELGHGRIEITSVYIG